jgi:hypothetical protein
MGSNAHAAACFRTGVRLVAIIAVRRVGRYAGAADVAVSVIIVIKRDDALRGGRACAFDHNRGPDCQGCDRFLDDRGRPRVWYATRGCRAGRAPTRRQFPSPNVSPTCRIGQYLA